MELTKLNGPAPGFEPAEHHLPDGVRRLNEQWIYRFPNGYGASVIRGPFSYGGEKGLWELGVLKFHGSTSALCYDTPITSDVEGHLTENGVGMLLEQIRDLPGDEVIDVEARVIEEPKLLAAREGKS